jgi:periplasmic nitrate reductase NapE
MAEQDTSVQGRREELKAFLLLTVITVPVISILVVSGYGFLVWFYQWFAGPPTGG